MKDANLIIKKVNNKSAIGTNKPLHQFKHLEAVLTAKSRIETAQPKKYLDKKNKKITNKDEINNVYKTYQGVLSKKSYVDCKVPSTIGLGKSKLGNIPNFENVEHQRRLKALGQRIPKYGSLQDRLKKKFDPVANPVYFFRAPQDEKGIKDLELNAYTKKIKSLEKKGVNKDKYYEYKDKDHHEIYSKKENYNNLVSSFGSLLNLDKLLQSNEMAREVLKSGQKSKKVFNEDLNTLKHKHEGIIFI